MCRETFYDPRSAKLRPTRRNSLLHRWEKTLRFVSKAITHKNAVHVLCVWVIKSGWPQARLSNSTSESKTGQIWSRAAAAREWSCHEGSGHVMSVMVCLMLSGVKSHHAAERDFREGNGLTFFRTHGIDVICIQ